MRCWQYSGIPGSWHPLARNRSIAPGWQRGSSGICLTKNVTGTVFPREGFLIPDAIPPNEADVDHVARLLLEASSPVLFLGDEISRAGAQAEALELAELLNIPAGDQGPSAFHNFPRRHELFAGRHSSEGKDLVVYAGVTDTPMGSEPADTTVVCIGLNTTAMGSNRPFDLAMVANVKVALRAVIDSVKSQATAERIASIASNRTPPDRWYREVDRAHLGLSPVHPDELGWALEQELDVLREHAHTAV